jgi:nucleoside-triphosphatase THEP1
MKLGYIIATTPGMADRTLASVAERLEARGIVLAGTVQTNTQPKRGGRCDMDVRVLGGGPVIRISQSLGPAAKGCRLDPAALERSVSEVAARLDDTVDLVLVNKFGKHEAEGRGFRPLIAEILDRGFPVLIAVNALNLSAFLDFVAGLGEELSGDSAEIDRWLGTTLRKVAA